MKIGFGMQCLLALIVGVLFGLLVNEQWVFALAPIGYAFLKLLKMLVIPLTFSLIVSSLGKLGDISHIKSIGGRTLGWFVFTAFVAALVGLIVALFISPNTIFSTDIATLLPSDKKIVGLSQVFLDMVPGNLVAQLSNEKLIPLIIFALLFGVALALVKDEAKTVVAFFDGFTKVMFKITRWIIRISPIGIFVLIAQVTAKYGLTSLLPFLKFIAAIYIACIIQLVFYGILLATVLRINPITYFRAIWPMMLVGFTTSSSLGTLPVTMDTLVKRVGVPDQIASFVGPLGATMKMDGCGSIYSVVVAIFTAALFNIPLTWQDYMLIIVVATVATMGTAGVPGTASVTAMVVLSSIGLPYAALAMVIGIDKIVDTIRTMTNVTGTAVCSTLVASQANEEWAQAIKNKLSC